MADYERKLPDNEVWERIDAALKILGGEAGVTVHGHGALEMSRRTLSVSQAALLIVQNKQADEADGLRPPPDQPSR